MCIRDSLNAGPLALLNLTFLVPDDELADGDMLIGLPVLKHLGIDTKTMLEQNRDVLDGADCSSVRSPSLSGRDGHVSRLMMARLNRVIGDTTKHDASSSSSRPRVNFYEAREEEDPFPDQSLIDPVDENQHCLLYTSPSPRDLSTSRMPSSA